MTPLFPGCDDAVGAFIRSYCGWHVAPVVTETVTLDAVSPWLPSLRVVAVGSVTVDGTLYTTDQFEWSDMGFLSGWFGVKRRSVVVEFTHGYEACPDDLRYAAGQLSKQLVSGVPVGASVRVGQVQVTGTPGERGLDSFTRGVLDRYRLPPRP